MLVRENPWKHQKKWGNLDIDTFKLVTKRVEEKDWEGLYNQQADNLTIFQIVVFKRKLMKGNFALVMGKTVGTGLKRAK